MFRPPPLSREALVIRGGRLRDREGVEAELEEAELAGDGPVLSVYCGEIEGGDLEASIFRICREACLPHGSIQVAAYGPLADNGLSLTWATSQGEVQCHYHMGFHQLDPDTRGDVLSHHFSLRDNPVPKNQRKGQRR